MSNAACEIHLVLPDAVERAACFRTLANCGTRIVRSFACADDYIAAEAKQTGGLLLFHWHQPGGTSGADLLLRLVARSDILSFVAAERLTLDESRAILRAGAYDLLPAPLDPRLVWNSIDQATNEWQLRYQGRVMHREAAARLAALTPRERDILAAIATGLGNKAIARQLDLSPRTVEVHRANLMRRAEAGSIAELLRLQFIAEWAARAAANPVQSGA